MTSLRKIIDTPLLPAFVYALFAALIVWRVGEATISVGRIWTWIFPAGVFMLSLLLSLLPVRFLPALIYITLAIGLLISLIAHDQAHAFIESVGGLDYALVLSVVVLAPAVFRANSSE